MSIYSFSLSDYKKSLRKNYCRTKKSSYICIRNGN